MCIRNLLNLNKVCMNQIDSLDNILLAFESKTKHWSLSIFIFSCFNMLD